MPWYGWGSCTLGAVIALNDVFGLSAEDFMRLAIISVFVGAALSNLYIITIMRRVER